MGERRDKEHLRRAIDLARTARQRGNQPFGAVLVGPGDVVIVEAENTEVTDRDCTAHAEMNLVRLSGSKTESRERAQCTLYASTEPCLMCAGAIYWANIRRVVYAADALTLTRHIGLDPGAPTLGLSCRDVLGGPDGSVAVVGPMLPDEGLAVHEGHWSAATDPSGGGI